MAETPPPKRSTSRPILACLAAAMALILFVGLARAVLNGETQQADDRIRATIYQHSSPRLTSLMQVLTTLGATSFLVPVGGSVALLLALTRRRIGALLFIIMMVGAILLNAVLKWTFQRGRPAPFFDLSPPHSFGFPSGHALFSCCFYGFLAVVVTARMQSRVGRAAAWGLAALVVATVGFSRVYLGVHYTTDVLGGYAMALVWAIIVAMGYRFLKHFESAPD